jgi:tRNA (mo5U34)-methyltransferase
MNSDDDINRWNLEVAVMAQPYWYHRIELPYGVITPGWAPIDASKYGIPDDLTGKRVLDIGSWDGYWTWEALKRGAAEVVAIDDFSDRLGQLKEHGKWETFDLCREAAGFVYPEAAENSWGNDTPTGQYVSRHEMSVYQLANNTTGEHPLGEFDIVFFFGTIYHLKHPLLSLECIAAVCTGELYIESAIGDDYSPYRGGMGHGHQGQMTTEFYPGKQYGGNDSNWWVPTLQCLGAMVESVGFKAVQAWPLCEGTPPDLAHCRGFAYGSKAGVITPNIAKLVSSTALAMPATKPLSVAAVMSTARLGFQDNFLGIVEGIVGSRIPFITIQGAFWGQCLERGLMQQIDTGVDAILTVDYDTVFKPEDVAELIRLMTEHPEADAVVPMQMGRGDMPLLMTVRTKSGLPTPNISKDELAKDLMPISTGHYGLTLFRTSSLLKLPHPWFLGTPDADGLWGPTRIDDDIHLWKLMRKAGMTVYSANRVVLGHLQLLVTWPDKELKPVYQQPVEFREQGRPENAWR